MKDAFVSTEELFLFLSCLNFCPNFFRHVGKRLDKKAKVNFKIHAVKNWATNNYDTRIAQYLKK